MYENTGPRPAHIDGQKIMLQPLSPEGLSCIVDYIRKNKKPRSAMDVFMDQIDRLKDYPKLQEIGYTKAWDMDKEFAERERFSPIEIPMSAFFDDDVAPLVLCQAASPIDPSWTLEKCTELVKRKGGLYVICCISAAFPSDPAKKDQASSGLFATGIKTSGQDSATTSVKEPNTDGTPPS